MINYVDAIKKTNAYSTIIKDLQNNKLSHTYLLVSEDQEYARQFARLFCMLVFDCDNDIKAKVKIEKDIHPDISILGLEEKIMTANVTELSSDVYIKPYEADKKAYILLNLDLSNEEAQNKLLKTIEEPPQNVFFILTASSERKLLPTVLSRAKKLELDLFDVNTISQLLSQEGVSSANCQIYSACAGGVVSRALKMATDKSFLELYENVFRCFAKMNSSRDVLDFSVLFSQKSVNKEEFAEIFMLVARDVYMLKAGNRELVCNKNKINQLDLIKTGFSYEALYKIIEYCLQLKQDLVYNTNVNMAIDEFLLKVVEVKVKCKA